jgi:hypothetical protein
MKIRRKHEMKVVLILMVLVMTFVSVSANFGYHAGFVIRWMKSWALSYIVALPVVMIAMPSIKKSLAKHIVD